MRECIVCLSILSAVEVFSMNLNERFEQIVGDNLNDPQAIVDRLRAWQQKEGKEGFPKIAQGFLEAFGGENFEPMEGTPRKHLKEDEEFDGELRNVALRIGDRLRELGSQEVNSGKSLNELRVAKTFLEFYYRGVVKTKGNSQHGFFFGDAPDVSSSLALDQLNGMIAAEEECVEAEDRLRKELENAEDSDQNSDMEDIGNLSDDDSNE